MKNIITILFLFYFQNSFATNYYASQSGGSDANNGTSTSTPWQTISKLNSVTFVTGDSILFKRGDTFYGLLQSQWGTVVIYGAYGTGAKPILTGFVTLSSWTNEGGGIYSSSFTYTGRLNAVSVDGSLKAMGRYPNTGYLTYQSHTGNTSVTSSSLTGTPNWTGAEVVIRKYRWVTDRQKITAQSGGTLTYSAFNPYGNNSSYNPVDNNGLFIQNALATLDTLYEWYFDSTASKLYMYFGSNSPSSYVVKVSNLDINVQSCCGRDGVIMRDIQFEGANINSINASYSSNISFYNCDFINQGGNGIYCIQGGALTVVGGSMTNVLNNGVFYEDAGTATTVDGMTFQNIGSISGAGKSGDGAQSAIYISGNYTTLTNNIIKNVGYCGIAFIGNNVLVQNNLIDSIGITKDDGGGIYTVAQGGTFTNRIIKKNIVLNALGQTEGVYSDYWSLYGKTAGIYLDDNSNNVNVDSNTVAHGNWRGIFINNGHNLNIRSNNVYDIYEGMAMDEASQLLRSLNITNNKFVAKTSGQSTLHITNYVSDTYSSFGTFDSNYYARPIAEPSSIRINPEYSGSGGEVYISLPTWKSTYSQDAHSYASPKTITDTSNLRFYYNSDLTPKVISLDANYIDVTGANYNSGSITLQPFTSAVLIDNGAFSGIKLLKSGGKLLKTSSGKLLKTL